MRLRVLNVNLGVEFKLDGVRLGLVAAGKGKLRRLEVELEGLGRDVGDVDGEVDDVLLGLGGGGTLGPENWYGGWYSAAVHSGEKATKLGCGVGDVFARPASSAGQADCGAGATGKLTFRSNRSGHVVCVECVWKVVGGYKVWVEVLDRRDARSVMKEVWWSVGG